jgi:hypothetical protein
MVDRKWTTKHKTLMTSSKIPRHLRLHRVTRWHLKGCPMHNNDVPPTNPVSPSRNELLVQGTDGEGPTHCVLLPSGIDGVDTEGNAPVPTLENINILNAAPVGIQEVATHPMPPSQPRQLFKSPASMPRRPVYMQPSMHPTLIASDPSPCVRASDTAESKDDLILACIQSFQRNHASLA